VAVDLEAIVDCPPMVYLTGSQTPALLLGWLRSELTGEWAAIVVWVRTTGHGERVSHQKLLVTARGGSVHPLEGPGAYAKVPRFLHTRTGQLVRLPGGQTDQAAEK
jgi:hypothetical protein